MAIIAIVFIVGAAGYAYYALQPATPQQQAAPAPKPAQAPQPQQPVPAPSAMSQVSDPKGDVGSKPSYLDIVCGQISLRGSSEIVFEGTVSDQIPTKSASYVAYGWFLTSGVSADRAIALAYDDKVGSWDAFILNTANKPAPTVLSKGLSFVFKGNSAQVTAAQSARHPEPIYVARTLQGCAIWKRNPTRRQGS